MYIYVYIIIQMPQVVGQTPITMAAAPPPDHPAPHDFLMLALVTTIICGILNLLSLAFGIPAIVLAALVCMHAINDHATLITLVYI